MSSNIKSKSGLIGFLEGSMKGIINTIMTKDTQTSEELKIVKKLTDVLIDSKMIWEEIKDIDEPKIFKGQHDMGGGYVTENKKI